MDKKSAVDGLKNEEKNFVSCFFDLQSSFETQTLFKRFTFEVRESRYETKKSTVKSSFRLFERLIHWQLLNSLFTKKTHTHSCCRKLQTDPSFNEAHVLSISARRKHSVFFSCDQIQHFFCADQNKLLKCLTPHPTPDMMHIFLLQSFRQENGNKRDTLRFPGA